MKDMPTFEFAAVRGIQGGRSYYVASVPFSILARLLAIDTGNTMDRSQRDVDKRRAKAVAKYIGDNPRSFVIPALTGIIQAENMQFIEHKDGSFVGTIQVPMDAEIKLFDGQHRAVGIMKAVKEFQGIPPSEVPVQLFTDMSLEDRKQAFADINSNAKAVSASLNQAYNLRDERTQCLASLAEIPVFAGKIEYQKNAVAGKSDKRFALKSLIEATQHLLNLSKKDVPTTAQLELAQRFWDMAAWPAGWNRHLTDYAFNAEAGRNELITFHAVGLLALGRLGGLLLKAGYGHEDDMKRAIGYLHDISLKRISNDWTNVCVTELLNMISTADAQKATAQKLFDFIRSKDAEAGVAPQAQSVEEQAATPAPKTVLELFAAKQIQLAVMMHMLGFSHSEFDGEQLKQADEAIDALDCDDADADFKRRFSAAAAAMNDAAAETSDPDLLMRCLTAIGQLPHISYLAAKAQIKAVLKEAECAA